jgi:hypothetical protein
MATRYINVIETTRINKSTGESYIDETAEIFANSCDANVHAQDYYGNYSHTVVTNGVSAATVIRFEKEPEEKDDREEHSTHWGL